jgi:oligopeptide transport system ATP-binding protein
VSAQQVVSHATAVATRDLAKTFSRGRRKGNAVYAVRGVSIEVEERTTLGLLGESGSGKSTLARLVMRLIEPTAGAVSLFGVDLTALKGRELRQARRTMQMVFQHSYSSLDPRMTVIDTLVEPLVVYGLGTGRTRRDIAAAAMQRVGLSPAAGSRYPHEFSGGQQQRIAIARSLVVEPKVLLLDEPLSSLDVSIQAQVLNLLIDLQESIGLTYLFISHDVQVLGQLADEFAVMYRGRVVEQGPKAAILGNPQHPYTQALLAAVPVEHPRLRARRAGADLVPDSTTILLTGCAYRDRCPMATEICNEVVPPLEEKAPGQRVACHLVPSSLSGQQAPRADRLVDESSALS